jgi:hypothetical protein
MEGRAARPGRHRLEGWDAVLEQLAREFGPSETVARSLAATECLKKLPGEPDGKPTG